MTIKDPSTNARVILCLLEGSPDHPIEGSILQGLSKAVEERGYQMVSGVIPIDPRHESRRLIQMVGNRLAGVALQPYRPNRELAELLLTPPLRTVPHILIGHYFDHLLINSCVVDNFGGMYAATRLLLRAGRRRLAFVGEISLSSTEHERYLGFCQACVHEGHQVPPEHFIDLFHEDDLRRSLSTLFAGQDPPDGFVCLYDGVAGKVLKVLAEIGIHVPHQAAVISFGDDLDIGAQTNPPLSAAHHPAEEMGAAAAHLLINTIEARIPSAPAVYVLPVSMRRRVSCGTRTHLQTEPGLEQVPWSRYVGVRMTLDDARAARIPSA